MTARRAVFAVTRLFLSVLVAASIMQCGSPLRLNPTMVEQVSGTEAHFIGISPADSSVVWISGTDGTYGRTVDGGRTWTTGVVPGADSLQFRDVHAVDADTAYLLSIGSGEQSRIYKTHDAGQHWALQFVNPEPAGFFDCFDFWDSRHGMAFSDSFEGSFYIITTADGGATWDRVPAERLPAARPGEGSFAASGHCLHVHGDSTAWIGTGAAEEGHARVLRTTDRGQHWTYHDTPIPGGAMRGITSVAFIDDARGAVLGGDVYDLESREQNIALSDDGGISWELAGRPGFAGPIYGAAFVTGAPVPTLVAVGPTGLGFTADLGASWTTLSSENYWTVDFAGPQAGWAAGRNGRITRISLYE